MPPWLTAGLNIVSGLVSLTNKAVSYFTKRADQKTGADIQEAKDAQSTTQAAMDRAKIDVATGGLPDTDLDSKLR